MQDLAKHQGEWISLHRLKKDGRVYDEGEMRHVTKQDLGEGKPVVIGANIYVIFLYDHVNLRYFLEHGFTATKKGELERAFKALQQECI